MARTNHVAALAAGALLALLSLLAPSRATAGPWTPEPGEGYAKLWIKWLPGFGYHAGNGDTYDYGAYHELFLATYGELGLADGLALTWHTELVRFFSLDDPRTGESDAHLAPGDPALGLRWRFLRADRFVMAVEASLRAPLASDDPAQTVYADAPGNPEIGRLRIGSGVFDVTALVSGGYGWDRTYVAAGAGWVARTGGYDHALVWTAELGGTFSETLSGRIRLSGYHSIRTGDDPRDESPSGIGNGTSYTGVAIEGEWQFTERWYLGLTLEGGALGVRRQTGGPVISPFLATRF